MRHQPSVARLARLRVQDPGPVPRDRKRPARGHRGQQTPGDHAPGGGVHRPVEAQGPGSVRVGDSRPTVGRRRVRQVQRAQRVQHQSDSAQQDRIHWTGSKRTVVAAADDRRHDRRRRPVTDHSRRRGCRGASHVRTVPSPPSPSPPVRVTTGRGRGLSSAPPPPTRPIRRSPTPSPALPQPSSSLPTAPTSYVFAAAAAAASAAFVGSVSRGRAAGHGRLGLLFSDRAGQVSAADVAVTAAGDTATTTGAAATAPATLLAEPARRHRHTGRGGRRSATASAPPTLAPVAPPAPATTPPEQSLRRWRRWQRNRGHFDGCRRSSRSSSGRGRGGQLRHDGRR